MFCIKCGTKAFPDAKFCANCGAALDTPPEQTESCPAAVKATHQANAAINNAKAKDTSSPEFMSSSKLLPPLPDGIAGWSWGAFLLNWVWSISNRVWIGLLSVIPFVGFIMVFVLGVKGREWAWKSRQWESVDQFNRVQKTWSQWGVGLFLFTLIAFAILTIATRPEHPTIPMSSTEVAPNYKPPEEFGEKQGLPPLPVPSTWEVRYYSPSTNKESVSELHLESGGTYSEKIPVFSQNHQVGSYIDNGKWVLSDKSITWTSQDGSNRHGDLFQEDSPNGTNIRVIKKSSSGDSFPGNWKATLIN